MLRSQSLQDELKEHYLVLAPDKGAIVIEAVSDVGWRWEAGVPAAGHQQLQGLVQDGLC